MRGSTRSRNRSITPPAPMIRKSCKRDCLSFQEVLALSKLEEAQRFKSQKSRTESKMLSARLVLPLRKASLSAEAVLCFTLAAFSTLSKARTASKTSASRSSRKPSLFPARPSQTTQDSKASPPSKKSTPAPTPATASTQARENSST